MKKNNKLTNWEFLLYTSLLGMQKLVETKVYENILNGVSDSGQFSTLYSSKEIAQQMLAETLGWA